MQLKISALGMFTKHSEIARRLSSSSIGKEITQGQTLEKAVFRSERDLLKTIKQSKFTSRREKTYFSGGLALIKTKKAGLIPTERARKVVEFSTEMDWVVSYLLGLSIGSFPRVKAFYDTLFEGAQIVYEDDPGQEPFPQFGNKRIEESRVILPDGDSMGILDCITKRIAERPGRYVKQVHESSGGRVDDDSLEVVDITWNPRTNLSFAALCGFGQHFIRRFFSEREEGKSHYLLLDRTRFLSNQWIREALAECAGFADLLEDQLHLGTLGEEASSVLLAYQRHSKGFDWVPWQKIANELAWQGLSPEEVYEIEKQIVESPIPEHENMFVLDNNVAVSTKKGPPGAEGLRGNPLHSYVRVWRY